MHRTRVVLSVIGVAFVATITFVASQHNTSSALTSRARQRAATTSNWAPRVTGHLVIQSRGTNPPSRVFGSVVSTSVIARAKKYNSWIASFSNDAGYALAYLNGFEYPLRSTNGGVTWRIDSPYWSGPWADAGAGAVYIDAYSASTAVAYGNQWLYVTTDAGHHWFLADRLGAIEAVEPPLLEWWITPALPRRAIIVDVARTGIGQRTGVVISRAQYQSVNGGRTWTLLPASR